MKRRLSLGLMTAVLALLACRPARYGDAFCQVNVRDAPYNAAGDGVADDSAALQSAITAAAGGVLCVPPGIYKVTSGLSISGALTLQGSGPRATILQWAGGAGTLLTVAASADNVTLEGFGFNNVGSGSIGIEVDGYHVLLDRVRTNSTVRWATAAIQSYATAIANVTLRDCQVFSSVSGQENPIGIALRAGNKFTIDSCYLSGNMNDVIVGVPGQVVSDFHLVNSLLETFGGSDPRYPGGPYAVALRLVSVDAAYIAGNHFDIAADEVVSAGPNRAIVTTTARGGAIVGNWFSGNGSATGLIDVLDPSTRNLLVTGNSVRRIALPGYFITVTAGGVGAVVHVGPNWRDTTNTEGLLQPANARRDWPLTESAVVVDSTVGDPSGEQHYTETRLTTGTDTIPLPVAGVQGQRITITIRNASTGTIKTNWHAVFKMAPWTDPAPGFSRSITFKYDGVANWVEVSPGTNVPN